MCWFQPRGQCRLAWLRLQFCCVGFFAHSVASFVSGSSNSTHAEVSCAHCLGALFLEQVAQPDDERRIRKPQDKNHIGQTAKCNLRCPEMCCHLLKTVWV